MHRFIVLLQPKFLRMLALGLILVASLLLLIQNQYGTPYRVVMGSISSQDENRATVNVIASHPLHTQAEIAVSASKLLLKGIENAGSEAEFLAVINQRGDRLVFERIYLLTAPESSELQGPSNQSGVMALAVGSKPELVEMVGLDKFGYQLEQPAWVKEKMPQADMVYYQRGYMDSVKALMDGANQDFQANVFAMDAQNRVMGIRSIGRRLLPLPEFLRRTALWLFAAAALAALGSLLAYKWSALTKAGRRIWDQVSMRGRKASS